MDFLKKKRIRDFFTNSFVFVNTGPYGSQNFITLPLLQIRTEKFQTSPEFLPNGRHKYTFGIFEI